MNYKLISYNTILFTSFNKNRFKIYKNSNTCSISKNIKINRYTKSLNLIWSILKDKKSELGVTGFVIFLLLVASVLIYNVEGEKQPDAFPNILAAFWWVVATLTTVGYGDVFPITPFGKFLSGIIAILGIEIIDLPNIIIESGFMDKLNNKKEKEIICPNCNKKVN